MERIKGARGGSAGVMTAALALFLTLSLAANAVQGAQNRELRMQQAMQRQRELADVIAAMADIEVNLQKLLIASGATQSVELLGETALLAQHVETGLSRLPLQADTAAGVMKFAGQMGQYVMTLVTQVSGGSMISSDDERQLGDLLSACRALNGQLGELSESIYAAPDAPQAVASDDESVVIGDSSIPYPSLIYDGPFSDGRSQGEAKGLTGERFTRQMAREAAARYAGAPIEDVRDAADSGGRFEAFGFTARTDNGELSVQVTGQGGHLLWMIPEQAQFARRVSQEECLQNAAKWLFDVGFGQMELCFVQEYGGMVVANFASVQDGVLLYPDQVKVQISMDDGAVVGAECTQYLTNHEQRTLASPQVSVERAQEMLSGKLEVKSSRLCVIPEESGERLCWGFEGEFAGETYWVFIDAVTGQPAQILRVISTQDGQTAV